MTPDGLKKQSRKAGLNQQSILDKAIESAEFWSDHAFIAELVHFDRTSATPNLPEEWQELYQAVAAALDPNTRTR